MTRRTILRLIGVAAAARTSAWASSSKEFWNDKQPSAWTPGEIQELLTKSPWTREGTVHDTSAVGSVGAGRSAGGGRRGGRVSQNPTGGATSSAPSFGPWKAAVRWESALPIREALKKVDLPGAADHYILNLLGNIPSPAIGPDEEEQQRQRALELLQNQTKLEHKGDAIALSRVDLAPRTDLSPAGTLFYFSRNLALELSDKEASFSTRIDAIVVKCKFILKDMLYRGNLEL
jgi:hypothetical protein